MDDFVLRLRWLDGGHWCRGLLVGLLAGLAAGLTLKWAVTSRAAQGMQRVHPAPSLSLENVLGNDLHGQQHVPQLSSSRALVAVCVGGWLELSIPR